jgi:type I restriction enzyme S subunit
MSSTEHTGSTAPSRARKLVRANDVIFATVRPTLKRIALVPDHLDGQIVSTAFCVLRANPVQADPYFIYYWLLTDGFIDRMANLQRGASYPAVSDGDVLKQEIAVPSLPEQRAIAAVLSEIQAAVEAQEKIVATLKELKAATTAKLYRKGLRGEPLKQTEIGKIPESWEVMRLGEVTSIERGKFAHRPRNEPRFYGGAIPFIQTGDVAKSNGRIRTYSQTLNEEGLAISRLFPKGTIVLTIAANIADTAILEFDSAFPDSLVGITPDGTMDAAFLEYYLRTQKADMDRLAPKGTQKNININFLKPWPTPRPSIEEQQEIAHTLRCLDDKLEMASARRDTLKSLFSSMLHLLMTGQVRVTPKMITLQRAADRAARRAKWSGKIDEKVLEQVVKRIVEAVAPEKIIVFGSAARGEMGPDSDLDLLIVKSGVHRLATAQMIEHSLIGITIPTDIVVATPKDIETHKNTIGLIYRPALQEGKILYAA